MQHLIRDTVCIMSIIALHIIFAVPMSIYILSICRYVYLKVIPGHKIFNQIKTFV